MAATPEWKVHNAAGEYKAACKDVEDAGILAEIYGPGAVIKNRGWGSKALYTVGAEIVGPDVIARAVHARCEALLDEANKKRAAFGVRAISV